MSIFINENTTYIIQGITGKEGQRALLFMKNSGSKILGGVRPGKAGTVVAGVSVYDTVKEIGPVDVSVIAVPPQFVKDAAIEAIDAGVKLIVPMAEGVPVKDTAWLYEYAQQHAAQLVGPNTAGILSPGKSKAGLIGGVDNHSYSPGPVGIISKSGGMTSETARLLTLAGIGQSTCVNIGGDKFVGTDIVDCLQLFAQDDETKLVVLFGEIGGGYEEAAAEYIKSSQFSKPVVAFISGQYAQQFRGVSLGHAGAIIQGNVGGWKNKVKALTEAGVHMVDIHHKLVTVVKSLI